MTVFRNITAFGNILATLRRVRTAFSPGDRITRAFLLRHGSDEATGCWVDIGAGTAPFAHVLKGWRYIALDVTRHHATDIIADAQTLPLADGCADLSTLLESLQYVPAPDAALREVRRVLKPGGRVIVRFPFLYPEGPDHSLHRWTVEGMRVLLGRNGFSVEAEARLGGPFLLICLEMGEFILRLVPGWRHLGQSRGWPRALLAVTANAILLPWQVLGLAAMMLDRLVPNPAHYQGAIVMARRDGND